MEFMLSDHAVKRAQKRKISIEWIQAALNDPDNTFPDAEDPQLMHAIKHIPEKNFKALRVIYNETVQPVTIVTVYFE